jgi:serine/threonine protein phosphatase PrpC
VTTLAEWETLLTGWLGTQPRGAATILADVASLGTHPGAARKANEDRVVSARFADQRGRLAVLLVVCDGVGGRERGGDCAGVAASTFALAVAGCFRLGRPALTALTDAAGLANRRVYDMMAGRGASTLCALLVSAGELWVCSTGDTRAYVLNDRDVEQVTPDDTLKGILDSLKIGDAEKGRESEHLLQYVGMGDDFHPHVFAVAAPESCRLVVACSDGAYRLPAGLHTTILRNARGARQAVDRLLSFTDWIGAPDDASVVAVSSDIFSYATALEASQQESAAELLVLTGASRSLSMFLDRTLLEDLIRRLSASTPAPARALVMGSGTASLGALTAQGTGTVSNPPVYDAGRSRGKKRRRNRQGRTPADIGHEQAATGRDLDASSHARETAKRRHSDDPSVEVQDVFVGHVDAPEDVVPPSHGTLSNGRGPPKGRTDLEAPNGHVGPGSDPDVPEDDGPEDAGPPSSRRSQSLDK